jgi:hypothetical protein
VLAAMEQKLSAILDVTIDYKPNAMGLWDFLCGRISVVTVRIKRIDMTEVVRGDYFEDESFRAAFQKWLNDLWSEKDRMLEALRSQKPHPE